MKPNSNIPTKTATHLTVSPNIRLAQAISEIETYSWIMLSCELVTKEFFTLLLQRRLDVRRLTTIKFAVLNSSVKKELESHGILAEYMPLSTTPQKLALGISSRIHSREKLLFLRNYSDSPTLTKDVTAILQTAGTSYDEVPIVT